MIVALIGMIGVFTVLSYRGKRPKRYRQWVGQTRNGDLDRLNTKPFTGVG